MLHIYFVQHWLNLADLTCEYALFDCASVRRFIGIDLGKAPTHDATPAFAALAPTDIYLVRGPLMEHVLP